MAENEAIDIFQEFVDLYEREDMLGFFGFTVNRPGMAPIPGLCRMSKPKGGDANMPYVSLTFVVDTPSDEARSVVQELLGTIDGDQLRKTAPGVADVVAVPVMSSGGDNYISQIDVLLATGTEPSRIFVGGTLLPAFRDRAGITLGEIVWWDDSTRPGQDLQASAAALSKESLLNTLKGYLSGYLNPDKK